MASPAWLPYITAAGAIATPILVAALGGIGWLLKKRMERRLELENKLRDDRIEIYNEILEPFIVMFMSDAAWNQDPKNKNKNKLDISVKRAISLEYRKHAFRLALVGSDGVVTAYNNLMQSFFHADDKPIDEEKIKNMLSLMGQLLLEIRRSTGNEDTKIDRWGMLEWFITDARTYRA